MKILETTSLKTRAILGAKNRPGGSICDDMDKLLPGFKKQIELVLADMVAAGHTPRVFETVRSQERIAFLVAKGTGSANSLHPYGIAVDIVDAELLWNAKQKFWLDLTKFSELRGLTCGSRWARVDLPHIQAIPKTKNAEFLKTPEADRDAYCTQFYVLRS